MFLQMHKQGGWLPTSNRKAGEDATSLPEVYWGVQEQAVQDSSSRRVTKTALLDVRKELQKHRALQMDTRREHK